MHGPIVDALPQPPEEKQENCLNSCFGGEKIALFNQEISKKVDVGTWIKSLSISTIKPKLVNFIHNNAKDATNILFINIYNNYIVRFCHYLIKFCMEFINILIN